MIKHNIQWIVGSNRQIVNEGQINVRNVNVYYLLFFNRDGIPPYKLGTKKQLQREMHRSVKINGQITLPHFPVSPTSLSSTSCLSVSFFCNLLNSNFYMLTDNWVLIPSRSCASFYFIFFQSSCCDRILYFIPPLVFV